jgi:signal transduction histidine kinase
MKSIRGKLFFWYATSLVSVSALFYLAVHIFSLPYGNFLFLLLLIALAFEGLFIIRKMTDGLTKLSSKIKSITSNNLNEKITDIGDEEEIQKLSVTFNGLLDRLRSAFQRERQFIGDVAHEVKTPLAAQRTNIEVALAKDRSKEEYRQALEESLVDNNRLATTLKNVLDLAWSEADAANAQFENFDFSLVVQEIKDLGTTMAVGKQIAVAGEIEPHLIISGQKDKLERALINLVDNAIKYTPQKGTVTFSLRKKRNQAQLKVKDTGRGIAEKDLPHIFERFYRGSKTDKTFGSGLGLSIAQAIVSAHRGEIRAKSQIGKGSEFTVLLPLASS